MYQLWQTNQLSIWYNEQEHDGLEHSFRDLRATPEPWEAYETEDGIVYYYNAETSATSWVWPGEPEVLSDDEEEKETETETEGGNVTASETKTADGKDAIQLQL